MDLAYSVVSSECESVILLVFVGEYVWVGSQSFPNKVCWKLLVASCMCVRLKFESEFSTHSNTKSVRLQHKMCLSAV